MKVFFFFFAWYQSNCPCFRPNSSPFANQSWLVCHVQDIPKNFMCLQPRNKCGLLFCHYQTLCQSLNSRCFLADSPTSFTNTTIHMWSRDRSACVLHACNQNTKTTRKVHVFILNFFKNLFVMDLLTDLQRYRTKKLFKASIKTQESNHFISVVFSSGDRWKSFCRTLTCSPYFRMAASSFVIEMF